MLSLPNLFAFEFSRVSPVRRARRHPSSRMRVAWHEPSILASKLNISLHHRMRGAGKTAVIALLLVAGCTDGTGGSNSDNAKSGGFYSGVSGGWSRP
jgi:hypothetical protein